MPVFFSFYGQSIVKKSSQSALTGADFHPKMAQVCTRRAVKFGYHIMPAEKPVLFLQNTARFAGTLRSCFLLLSHTQTWLGCMYSSK